MPAGKCVMIGLGSIGLQLVRMLSRDFDLVCIDVNAEMLETVRKLRGEALVAVRGDATSRLVLEEAGVGEADTVIITTTAEKVNIEIARVLHDHFEVPRVVSIGITQKGIEKLESLGVEVESIFTVSATGLRNRLEHKTKTVHGIGLGKNEILEVEVHPHSRLAGKTLAALNPKTWNVGIIYRDGGLLIPKGDTILRPKDKVIILGDPKVLKTVADLLTFRFTLFPLEYGDTLVAWLGDGDTDRLLAEIDYLLTVFPLKNAYFLLVRQAAGVGERLREIAGRHQLQGVQTEAVSRAPIEALRQGLKKLGRRPALVVLPKSLAATRLPFRHDRGKPFLQQVSALVGCPLVLAAGTFPYERVAVPCLEPAGLQHALETTLEMSSAIRYRIEALFVSLSPYISSEEEAREQEAMHKTVTELSSIYKASIRTVELEGNPVREVAAALAERNLMVADMGSWRRGGLLASLLRPDVAWLTVRRSPVSTLLIPPMEIIA